METEKLAMFNYYCELGRRMNIGDIPDDFEDFENYNRQYERTNPILLHATKGVSWTRVTRCWWNSEVRWEGLHVPWRFSAPFESVMSNFSNGCSTVCGKQDCPIDGY